MAKRKKKKVKIGSKPMLIVHPKEKPKVLQLLAEKTRHLKGLF